MRDFLRRLIIIRGLVKVYLKDYYTFVECYNIAVDYNMYVRLGDINKADELKEQFEDNTRLLQRKIFKEALETVKNTYIVVS